MYIIDTSAAMARALDQPVDFDLRQLLVTRRDQLAGRDDVARFLVAGPDDRLADVEAALGLPLLFTDGPDETPFWEWAERHPGGWLELCFTSVEDGPADVLLANEHSADQELIAIIHRHASEDLEERHVLARQH